MAVNLQQGQFAPTTNVWDTQPIVDLNADPQLKELLIRLYQNLNIMSVAINNKSNAFFDNSREMVTGAALFPDITPDPNFVTNIYGTLNIPRPIFRTVINSGMLPNATTNAYPHNIDPNSQYTVTAIWGAATKPSDTLAVLEWIPLPYVDPTNAANNIGIYADGTNAYITTVANYSAYIRSQIYIEYIKY